jgi:fructokinase
MQTLCVGETLVELVCERPVSSVTEAGAFVPSLGGSTALAAITASRRGADVALAGGTGADAWGVWLREQLAAERVDLTWFTAAAAHPTAIAFVTVDADGVPSVTPYGDDPVAAVARLGDGLPEAVDATDALLISSATLAGEEARAVTLAARERALAAGKPVVLDPDLRLAQWRSAAAAAEVVGALVDGAFLVRCNADEARVLTGEAAPDAAAASLLAAGAGHVVVTLGADGALLRGGGVDRDVRAVPVSAVAATGAGAAVTGVLLAALSRTGFYPAALAAMLPDAMQEGARAVGRFTALGPA